jgi:hypothetical protein
MGSAHLERLAMGSAHPERLAMGSAHLERPAMGSAHPERLAMADDLKSDSQAAVWWLNASAMREPSGAAGPAKSEIPLHMS